MRNDTLILQSRVLAVLLDGKAHSLSAFEQIREDAQVIKKTILRHLRAWEDVPEVQVISFVNHGKTFWRCDRGLLPRLATALTKTCTECLATLSTEEHFGRSSGSPDGFKYACIECSRAYKRQWLEKNRDFINKRRRERRKKNAMQSLYHRNKRAVLAAETDAVAL